ncbi:hypothetical protein EFS38_06325 [Dickeya undicola]|uniref:Uncharacterized protein n=1 Tax=Dickeya undicola TaxID=1577887 RepID=A0ABX9WYV9_9GAMM|nr:hypothetical protein EFS38_06325 [Dickeya undicola]
MDSRGRTADFLFEQCPATDNLMGIIKGLYLLFWIYGLVSFILDIYSSARFFQAPSRAAQRMSLMRA